MKNSVLIIGFLAGIFPAFFSAQMMVRQDTLSGTPLAITMDEKINKLLVDMEEKCENTSDSHSYTINDNTSSKTKITVPDKNMSKAEICRRNPRIMGYKIQIDVVKSNDDARQIGLNFRKRFPSMKVEIDASLRPNYKVMAGSYFTKESANSDLRSIRQYFKSAIPIQYRVFCVEAK